MQEVNRSTCNSKVTEAKDQKYGYSGWTACFSINVVFNKFTTLYFLSWECQKRCKSSQSSLLVLSNSQPQERVGGWASPLLQEPTDTCLTADAYTERQPEPGNMTAGVLDSELRVSNSDEDDISWVDWVGLRSPQLQTTVRMGLLRHQLHCIWEMTTKLYTKQWEEICIVTDHCLHLGKVAVQATGRSMGLMVLQERVRWLNLTDLTMRERRI